MKGAYICIIVDKSVGQNQWLASIARALFLADKLLMINAFQKEGHGVDCTRDCNTCQRPNRAQPLLYIATYLKPVFISIGYIHSCIPNQEARL